LCARDHGFHGTWEVHRAIVRAGQSQCVFDADDAIAAGFPQACRAISGPDNHRALMSGCWC
jgi:hypothetical protein